MKRVGMSYSCIRVVGVCIFALGEKRVHFDLIHALTLLHVLSHCAFGRSDSICPQWIRTYWLAWSISELVMSFYGTIYVWIWADTPNMTVCCCDTAYFMVGRKLSHWQDSLFVCFVVRHQHKKTCFASIDVLLHRCTCTLYVLRSNNVHQASIMNNVKIIKYEY